jgi:hypothetical protein
MRPIRLWLVLLLVWIVFQTPHVAAQGPPIVGPNDAIGFDYFDTEMTAAEVTMFQVQYDGGVWINLGIPPGVVLATTLPGAKTYKANSPFTSGTHSVVFRACNTVGCGGGSVPFAFAHGASTAPGAAPGNVRKVPR